MRRNLYFFVYPLKPEIWRQSVRKILSYWPVFNGRKLVAVAEDEKSERVEAVLREFGGRDVEFMIVQNYPELGQTASFVDGLSRLESCSSDEATFYAHAKGQRWEDARCKRIIGWTDAMLLMNLECPALVDAILSKYCAMGCFKVDWVEHGGAPWHYSGSFYWLRHDALFSRKWRNIERSFYGTEGYPGRMFKTEDAFMLTPKYHWDILYTSPPDEKTCRQWLVDLIAKHVGYDHRKKCMRDSHIGVPR